MVLDRWEIRRGRDMRRMAAAVGAGGAAIRAGTIVVGRLESENGGRAVGIDAGVRLQSRRQGCEREQQQAGQPDTTKIGDGPVQHRHPPITAAIGLHPFAWSQADAGARRPR